MCQTLVCNMFWVHDCYIDNNVLQLKVKTSNQLSIKLKSHLMHAFRPPHRNPIPIRRRNQTNRCLLRQRTMSLPIVIHLSTQLTIPPWILARHMIHLTWRTSLNTLPIQHPFLNCHHQTVALFRINGGRSHHTAATKGGVKENKEEKE